MINAQQTNLTQLWGAGTFLWSEQRIWYYPIYTRINNTEV